MGSGLVSDRRRWLPDAVGFAVAALLPALLWHDTVVKEASAFRADATYLLAGWSPWALMATGLACFVPVLVERLRGPGRRFAGRPLGPWYAWSTTLYLLGFVLATQVAQIVEGISGL